MAELVRERHQNHSAQARLHVLLGGVFGKAGKNFGELFFEDGEGVRDRHLQALDAQVPRKRERVIDASARGVRARHRHAENIRRAKRMDCDRRHHGRIDATAQPQNGRLEVTLIQIIPET